MSVALTTADAPDANAVQWPDSDVLRCIFPISSALSVRRETRVPPRPRVAARRA